jgi:hypothetical protein
MGKTLDKDRKTNTYITLLTTYLAMSRDGIRNNIIFFLEKCKSRANFREWQRFNSVLKFYTIYVWHNRHINKSKFMHVLQCLIVYDFFFCTFIPLGTKFLIWQSVIFDGHINKFCYKQSVPPSPTTQCSHWKQNLYCVVKQSLWVYQAPVMTYFCSLINTHEFRDAYEKRTRVYSSVFHFKQTYHCCHTLDKKISFGVSLMNCKFDGLLWAYLIQWEKTSYIIFLQALKLYFLLLPSVLLKLPSWNCIPHYKILF